MTTTTVELLKRMNFLYGFHGLALQKLKKAYQKTQNALRLLIISIQCVHFLMCCMFLQRGR